MNPNTISEAELHAYVDGALPQARSIEVAAYLASNPQEAARIHAYQAQKQALPAARRL